MIEKLVEAIPKVLRPVREWDYSIKEKYDKNKLYFH